MLGLYLLEGLFPLSLSFVFLQFVCVERKRKNRVARLSVSFYMLASLFLPYAESMYRVLHLNTRQYDGLPIPSESDRSRNTRADIIDECVRG